MKPLGSIDFRLFSKEFRLVLGLSKSTDQTLQQFHQWQCGRSVKQNIHTHIEPSLRVICCIVLYCDYFMQFVFCAVVVVNFCNVWVCVCVDFVMCGCVYVWIL